MVTKIKAIGTSNYHIFCEGERITASPVSLEFINDLYGSVAKLERQGFRLLKVGVRK